MACHRSSLKAYSEPSQTTKMELFAKIVKGFKPLTIFAINLILNVRLDSEYTSAFITFFETAKSKVAEKSYTALLSFKSL